MQASRATSAEHRRPRLLVLLLLAIGFVPPGGATAQDGPGELFSHLEWRNIGPANMSGRVLDIQAVESNPAVVYVGAASGGVWKSTNGGTTWQPVFERYGTGAIGSVAVFQPNPDIVWVGTGEPCVRNSVSWGDGVYKSTDGGRTFTNVGLKDSHHIADVVTHPTNAEVVYVASQGHLWDHGGEMGVFRTRDGGRTWQRLSRGLPDDGRTGASALVMDPSNPNVLYAAFWQRLRRPYRFDSGGENGGIFKSTDGGDSWTKLTNGLPTGETGNIGLAIYRRDPRILMAIVEHGFRPGQDDPDYQDMTKLGTGMYRSEDGGQSWTYVSRYNNRPFYFSHIWMDPSNSQRVFVLAGSAQVSEDGGRTFSSRLQGIEGDFHAFWMDPNDSRRYYVGNDKGAYVTYDGGESFIMFDNMDIGQFYAVTADNRDPYYVYGGLQDSGNWGGPSNSRDFNGILNDHWFKFHSGDGFHTTVDPNDWTTVYTESQGGGIRRLDAQFRQIGGSIAPRQTNILNYAEHYPDAPSGGRGSGPFRFNWSSPLVLSPHASTTLLFGGNHLFRSTDRGDTWTIISPDLSTRDPVLADPESGGLTRDVTGAETHATIYTISESPMTPGVIWVGTDDGNVQLTSDGGRTWTNVRPNLPGVPERTWVSRVEASRFADGTAYIVFDGHRNGDMRPYIYKTADFGRTWVSLSGGLPQDEPVYVVREDLKNPRLLFAGTERTAYASLDGGDTWTRVGTGLPTVPVHDLVIHPRDGDLIAATHGRSIWILDDITALQQLTPAVLASDVHLFENRVATKWRGISRGATRGHMLFQGRNPLTISHRPPANSPSELQSAATITFWLKDAPGGPVRLTIEPAGNDELSYTTDVDARQGINRVSWNLRLMDPAAAEAAAAGGGRGGRGGQGGRGGRGGGFGRGGGGEEAGPGSYVVQLEVGGRTHTGTLRVRDDPMLTARSGG